MSRKKNCVSIATNRLMLFTKVTNVYSQNSAKHANTFRGKKSVSVMLKQKVYIHIPQCFKKSR
jgi:hypothetical protein